MYYIAVYDVNQKRVARMLKLLRKYLNWIQNSVFEGELTGAQMEEMLVHAKEIMDTDEDSLIIFEMTTNKYLDKKIIGKDKGDLTSNFV